MGSLLGLQATYSSVRRQSNHKTPCIIPTHTHQMQRTGVVCIKVDHKSAHGPVVQSPGSFRAELLAPPSWHRALSSIDGCIYCFGWSCSRAPYFITGRSVRARRNGSPRRQCLARGLLERFLPCFPRDRRGACKRWRGPSPWSRRSPPAPLLDITVIHFEPTRDPLRWLSRRHWSLSLTVCGS